MLELVHSRPQVRKGSGVPKIQTKHTNARNAYRQSMGPATLMDVGVQQRGHRQTRAAKAKAMASVVERVASATNIDYNIMWSNL